MYVSAPFDLYHTPHKITPASLIFTPGPNPAPAMLQLEAPEGLPPAQYVARIVSAFGMARSGRCIVAGCANDAHLCGRCEAHEITPTCAGPECERPPTVKGFCQAHYVQSRSGRPLSPVRARSSETTVALTLRVPLSVLHQLGPAPGIRILEILTAHLTPQKGSL